MSLVLGTPTVIYFGNLTDSVTVDQVRTIASRAGKVTEVSGGPGGRFAYVAFDSVNAANNAVATLNGQEVEGRKLRVEPSRATRERTPAVDGEVVEHKESKDRIVVRNLPRDYDVEQLRNVFRGNILKVGRRYHGLLGAVQFETPAEAEAALALTGTKVGNVTITVELQSVAVRPRKEGGEAAAPRAPRAPAAERAPRAPKAAGGEPRPKRRVRVDNVPASVSVDALKGFFNSCGPISNATLEGGVGIVTFEDGNGAIKAVQMNGAHLSGTALAVEYDAGRVARASGEGGVGRRRTAQETESPEDRAARVANTVWVGAGTKHGVTEAAISKAFSRFGAVASADVRLTFTYVKYVSQSAVNACVEAGPATVDGVSVPVNVEVASGVRPKA